MGEAERRHVSSFAELGKVSQDRAECVGAESVDASGTAGQRIDDDKTWTVHFLEGRLDWGRSVGQSEELGPFASFHPDVSDRHSIEGRAGHTQPRHKRFSC
jgi:hypothetical protein